MMAKEKEKTKMHEPLQGYTPSNLRTFPWALPIESSTVSLHCGHGDRPWTHGLQGSC